MNSFNFSAQLRNLGLVLPVDDALEQVQAGRDIVAEIEKRLLHRLAYQRPGCEVHDGIRPMLAKSGINSRSIRKIALNKNGLGMHRCPVTLREIVKYHHRLT
jgi:hypothetical protein